MSFRSSSFSVSNVLSSQLHLPFFSLTRTLDSSVYSWDMKCWEHSKKIYANFLPCSKERILIRILKESSSICACSLMPLQLFSLPEIHSFYLSPIPPNPDTPPLRWNAAEVSVFCLWQRLLQAPVFLNGGHVSCPSFTSLLEFTEPWSWRWEEERYWEDSDRKKLIGGDLLYCYHWRWFIVNSSGYRLFLDRSVLDFTFVGKSWQRCSWVSL